MINKKICKVLGPILGIMGFMLTIGILGTPVLAADNIQTISSYTNSTTSSAVTYKDYSINVNKSMIQNGIKVTLEKITVTKHKLSAVIKAESTTPFDQTKNNNSIVQLLYGDNNHGGESTSNSYIDDKTLLITIDQDNDYDEYSQTGDIRLDVVFPNYKVNMGMDAKVDFSDIFKYTFDEDINKQIPTSNYTLNKLESDILGTVITYSAPNIDHDDRSIDSSMILKVGDKMYKLRSSGTYSDDKGMKGSYEAKAATYDMVKDQKDISLIPLTCNMTWDEFSKIHKNNKAKESTKKEITNNVSYLKYFEFSDGSKGEIYNIERNANSLKVYCKGTSEKASLLLASSMDLFYGFREGETYYTNYDSDNYMSFYKDPKDALGYIVEFNNLDKDKALELIIRDNIKYIDRYSVGTEIQLSK